MAGNPWHLYDPVTTGEYYWPVNPHKDNGSHGITKNTLFESYAGLRQSSSGEDRIDAIIGYAGMSPQAFSYSGIVYTSEQLEALEEWALKSYAVILTDDLGREFSVLFESFKLDRVRSNKYQFKHAYTLTGFVLEEL